LVNFPEEDILATVCLLNKSLEQLLLYLLASLNLIRAIATESLFIRQQNGFADGDIICADMLQIVLQYFDLFFLDCKSELI
jgi:hypothetical protein